jgi:5-methylcytosine-specific restriction endonuclease McrA
VPPVHDDAVFCSKNCKSLDWWYRQPEQVEAAKLRTRREALRELRRALQGVARIKRRRDRAATRAEALRSRSKRVPLSRIKPCDCGAWIRWREKWCAGCRLQNKRAARAARKAFKRGATVERFRDVEVLERDGWRCQICGVATPKRLRGTFGPTAPEVDHIVPLARGGAHSRANTQCACRRCNLAKSDGPPIGQMNIFTTLLEAA